MHAFLSLLFSGALHAQVPSAVIKPARLDHVYVAQGFDDNDTVELVVSGTFPNTCYSVHNSRITIRGKKISVRVTALVRPEFNKACLQMRVPFFTTVALGNLRAGSYDVVINEGAPRAIHDRLGVKASSSLGPDDHIYASVDYIDLGLDMGRSGRARLVGVTPSDCLELDRVEYVSNGRDTLAVLPIMKQVKDECPSRPRPLSVPIEFDLARFPHHRLLLMARSLEGKAVFNFVETAAGRK